MSDTNTQSDEPKVEAAPSTELPPQQSPRDTSNWDDKVSVDPNGEMNIRAD